ncbi:MAG: TIGR02281 family clan AA aspartic protease [Alphaproteobacteria bacterium]|nr:TIGR02281 family clan AA aspartic protease [Alphaproteobacteria bacterium]
MNDAQEPWGEDPKPRRKLPMFWLFAIAIAGIVALLIWRFPTALDAQGGWANLVYLLAFLILIAGGFFHKGIRARQILQYSMIWIGFAGVVGLGYAYRFELATVKDRVLGELIPGAGVRTAGGEIQFRADASGHYVVEALIDGTSVRFLVDTGASDVVLSPRDAERIGYDITRLDFSRQYRTANGIVKGAPINLPSVRVGPIHIPNVAGSVNGAPLDASLLGMSFLERLTSYRVENGTLILRQ